MFASVLIANRGEIALRITRTARRLGLRTIAVFSDADMGAPHTRAADEAHGIGPARASESYLRIDRILEVARRVGAECVHPGYGFLAESADLAEGCAQAGVTFVGPPARAIRIMGLKHEARAAMEKVGVPVLPGASAETLEALGQAAGRMGYPVALKPVAGGGGKGLRRVARAEDLADAFETAQREARNTFGDARLLVEKWLDGPRHIEVQIFADARGNAVHLYERDCSLQRRHQKIVEESPAPGMTDGLRARMTRAALAAARAVNYANAGTVEFLVAGEPLGDRLPFYFLEMNARLQVEHPVTEAVTGLDLVEWQFRIAAGEPLPCTQDEIALKGCAVEARLYAEEPERGFLPSPGRIYALRWPQQDGLRIDSGAEAGGEVSPHYDPLLAKLIATGTTRDEALSRLRAGLAATSVAGPRTNLAFLHALLGQREVAAGVVDTVLVDRLRPTYAPPDPEMVRLGVAALLLKRQRTLKAARAGFAKEQNSPWDAGDRFRLGLPRPERHAVLVNGERLDVSVAWDGNGPRVSLDGKPMPAPSTAARKAMLIDTEDGVIVLRALRQVEVCFPRHESHADLQFDTGALRAPMHGRIVRLYAAPGQSVRKGERIAVLEAMKMEHVLTAPMDGVVREMKAAEREQVAQGALVATIRDDEEA